MANHLSGLEESATLELNARVKSMAEQGRKVYNLTAGELPCQTPKYIEETVALKLKENKYTPAVGLLKLRNLAAEETNRFYSVKHVSSANIVITPSVKPAIYMSLLALLNPGDQVIIPAPTWPSYFYQVRLAGGVPVVVNLDENFDLDVEAIAAQLNSKTKAIILSSPNNPTGTVFSAQKLSKLSAVLEPTNVCILSDDIYNKLVYTNKYKPPAFYNFKKIIIFNGFSKSHALTGWRIGYLTAEKRVAEAIAKIQSQIIGNASLPSQYGAIAALENGNSPVMLKELMNNRKILIDKLAGSKNIRLIEPDGAFYGFLDISKITKNSKKWSSHLLEKTGVAVVPGEIFFAPGFVRLNFAVDEKILTKGLDLLLEYTDKEAEDA